MLRVWIATMHLLMLLLLVLLLLLLLVLLLLLLLRLWLMLMLLWMGLLLLLWGPRMLLLRMLVLRHVLRLVLLGLSVGLVRRIRTARRMLWRWICVGTVSALGERRRLLDRLRGRGSTVRDLVHGGRRVRLRAVRRICRLLQWHNYALEHAPEGLLDAYVRGTPGRGAKSRVCPSSLQRTL